MISNCIVIVVLILAFEVNEARLDTILFLYISVFLYIK